MLREDTKKLIKLMNELYGNPPKLRSAEAEAAWYLALKPFTYQQCKEKLMEHYRGPRRAFVPDPKDLIPEIPEEEPRYTPDEVERAYRQALWAQAGHTGLWRPGDEL